MSATDELVPMLKRLRLSGLLHTLELRSQQAVDDKLSYVEFIHRLLSDEVERRDAKKLDRRLNQADFEAHKTLEDFDFTFNPKIPREQIIELGTTSFVARHENALLIGPAGTGKSHIAQAIGHRACRAGHKTLYIPAHRLLCDLRAARADQSWEKQMYKLCALDLLIIDDLGLRPLAQDEPVDLYEIIRRRYEKGSLIITSNRDISEWYTMFGDALLASSAMDRLLHHSHVVTLDGHSYRNPPSKHHAQPAKK
jgi:DNA replication protein DnaC